jgi:U4/U6.U5 tri-snRNP-associated protein 1
MPEEKEISLSIEEMNKLRVSLGLKPLEDDREAKQRERKREEELRLQQEKEERTAQLAAQTKKLKKQRELAATGLVASNGQLSGPTIAAQAEDTDDALAWIERSRKLERIKAEQRALAAQRTAELAALDAQIEASAYSTKDLAGLKVAHDANAFNEEATVLVLKDQSVLEDDEPELENPLLADAQRRQAAQEAAKKKLYDPHEDQARPILHKYDDDFIVAPAGFHIGTEHHHQHHHHDGQESQTLSHDVGFASEYMTPAEFAKLSRRRAKPRTALTGQLRTDALARMDDAPDALARMDDAPDARASRDASSKLSRDAAQAAADAQRRAQRYEHARTALNTQTRAHTQAHANDRASALAAAVRDRLKAKAAPQSDGIVFNADTAFVRAIAMNPTEKPVEAPPQLPQAPSPPQMLGQWRDADADADAGAGTPESHEHEHDRERVEMVDELAEQEIGSGLASALAVLRSKGAHKEQMQIVRGRTNDERIDVNDGTTHFTLNYLDAQGRPLTQKEAFRELSHRFHGRESGKRKTEAALRKLEDARKRHIMPSNDTPLHTAEALRLAAAKAQQPFIVLSGTGAQPLPTAPPEEPRKRRKTKYKK